MYLTYEAYQACGGTMSEADFIQAEFRARKRIDWLTDNRVAGMSEVPEAVKQAMLTIIRVDGAVGADAQARTPLVLWQRRGQDGRSGDAAERRDRAAALRRDG